MYEIFDNKDRAELFVESTLSTNDDLKKMIYSADGPVCAFIRARRQLSGKGRLGRSFFSPEGGLYFSLSYPLSGKENNIPFITLLAGLAASEAIERLAGVKTEIKWPNDIYLNGKKLGGILCELVSSKSLTAVVGIGINLSVPVSEIPSELRDIMTSFCAEGLTPPLVTELARSIAERLDKLVYSDGELFSAGKKTLESIKARSFSIGKKVRYSVGENTLEGVITDISETGAAVLELPDGSKKEIFYGEITQ